MESIKFFAKTRAKGKKKKTMEITIPIEIVRNMEIKEREYYGFEIEKERKKEEVA